MNTQTPTIICDLCGSAYSYDVRWNRWLLRWECAPCRDAPTPAPEAPATCVYCGQPAATGFSALCEQHLAMCIPCVESHAQDETPHVGCVQVDCYCFDCHAPDPRTPAAREAAQRADEAELLVLDSLPQIPTYSDHPNGIIGALVEYLDPALYAEKFPQMAGGNKAPRCPDCGESEAARDCEPGVLATLPPMAGGDGSGATLQEPRCVICKERPVNPNDGVLCDSCWAHYNSHGDDPCPTCPPFTEAGS